MLTKALEEYTSIYMPYRNFAERTREEYQNDLEDFIVFAEKSGVEKVNGVGLPIIERFIAGLEHKGYSSLTRKRKVVTIRSFFSFLYRDGYILANLASKIILPFTETTTPHILTQTECDYLRAACANNPRDQAIIEVLLQTGIRLSELTHLTLNDIDLGSSEKTDESQVGYIRILGIRGKKERPLPLNSSASLALKKYLKVREKAGNGILFLNRFGEPVSDRGVQKMLRKYLKRAGIEKASIHTLRHTFGTYCLAKGESVRNVKELMGYRDNRSVNIYKPLVNGITKRTLWSNLLEMASV